MNTIDHRWVHCAANPTAVPFKATLLIHVYLFNWRLCLAIRLELYWKCSGNWKHVLGLALRVSLCFALQMLTSSFSSSCLCPIEFRDTRSTCTPMLCVCYPHRSGRFKGKSRTCWRPTRIADWPHKSMPILFSVTRELCSFEIGRYYFITAVVWECDCIYVLSGANRITSITTEYIYSSLTNGRWKSNGILRVAVERFWVFQLLEHADLWHGCVYTRLFLYMGAYISSLEQSQLSWIVNRGKKI